MDNSNSTLNERRTLSNVNGSAKRSSACTPSSLAAGGMGASARPVSLADSQNFPPGHQSSVRVVVIKYENGYGMKVSGDNPVFIQSVKQGGAAEKAGLHAGDRIMEVNGINVISSTHTDVVELIKSSNQVELKVHHKTGGSKIMGSPGIHARPFTTHNPSRITGPQPVDNEKQVQLQLERAQQLRRMIETEQIYIEKLRCSIASTPDEKQGQNLEKAERNLEMLLNMLKTHQGSTPSMSEQSTKDSLTDSSPPPPLPSTPPPKNFAPED